MTALRVGDRMYQEKENLGTRQPNKPMSTAWIESGGVAMSVKTDRSDAVPSGVVAKDGEGW